MDQRLSWNHTQWGGIKAIYIPHQKIWKPDIILVNKLVFPQFIPFFRFWEIFRTRKVSAAGANGKKLIELLAAEILRVQGAPKTAFEFCFWSFFLEK